MGAQSIRQAATDLVNMLNGIIMETHPGTGSLEVRAAVKTQEFIAALEGLPPDGAPLAESAYISLGDGKVPLAEVIEFYQEQHANGTQHQEDEDTMGKKTEALHMMRAAMSMLSEVDGSLRDVEGALGTAFRKKFQSSDDGAGYLYVRDSYIEDPQLGDCVVVECEGDNGMTLYQVPYTKGEAGEITFTARESWIAVKKTYIPVSTVSETASEEEPVAEVAEGEGEEDPAVENTTLEECDFAESATGHIIGEVAGASETEPLILEVALIEPGWGRMDHKNFYPAEVLARDAHVFNGVKMYTTNHVKHEEPNEVGVVMESPVGFTETGGPIAKVGIFDPPFAQKVRNRAKLKALDTLECSVLARGSRRPKRIDGVDGFLVEGIVEGKSVDWVSKAGAGGRALNLAESGEEGGNDMQGTEGAEPDAELTETGLGEAEGAESEVVTLSEAQVAEVVDATRLPEAFRVVLKAAGYEDEEALTVAVGKATQEFKEAVGSGDVFGQGAAADDDDRQEAPLSEAQMIEDEQEWYQTYLADQGLV